MRPLPTVAAAHRAHKVRELEERLVAGDRWRERGLVFATTIGTPPDARNAVRHFKATLARGPARRALA